MTTEPFISKTRSLPPAADFGYLRAEGLAYIESLAHELWTDYNTHDPGITIMEALCYAITELSYRCSFDIKDLLADGKGSIGSKQPFFSPREILTNEPYSLQDYRKLLIDLPGVANAWIYPALNDAPEVTGGPADYKQTEVPLYPDCKKDRLSYSTTHHPPIDMRGLYHVRLDLDLTDEFGDLNSSNIDFTIFTEELRGARVECILPRYNEVDFDWLETWYAEEPFSVSATALQADAFGRTTRWGVLLVYKKNALTTQFQYEVLPSLKVPVPQFENLLEAWLKLPLSQQQIMELYYHKTRLIRGYVQQAWEKLHAHRNLCEDWWTVDTIRNTPVAICADVEVRPEADLERVYGAIIVAIEQYLNPPLRFYSLKELMARNIPVEDIFEGPKLEHGFLLSDEVEAAALRQHIYVSDLIHIIMDIEHVVAVKNVLLTAYDDAGKAMLPSQKWCLHIDPDHKPVLDIERSKLLFYKQNLPYTIRAAEAMDTILYLRGLNQGQKIPGAEQDLPLPMGRYQEWQRYSSLQHDLPDTYGTGPAGLPETASPGRKAQARQLKAYLMFYDQILAGFFSQLSQAKNLLGLDPDLQQSYFQQFLEDWEQEPEYGIRNITPVYTDPARLRLILSAPQAAEDPSVRQARQRLIEDEATRYDRRNRFLDHLIARFAETFNEYVLMLHASASALDQQELIADKIRFLKDYPRSSSRRGTAYNILGDLWDTANVSGLEQRIARLSGINDPNRRALFCYTMPDITDTGTPADPNFTFTITDSEGQPWLQPLQGTEFRDQALRLLNEVFENMLDRDRYQLQEASGNWTVVLHDSIGNAIARAPETFTSEAEAETHLSSLIAHLTPACDPEGMHLFEHILLRPYFEPPAMPPQEPEEVYRLMKVCLPEDCLFCGEEDPYSFRATVVLPYWPSRFRDFNFRTFFEQTIRREAPAHVHVKVCWISFTAMYALEAAYREWLGALKDYRKDQLPDDTRRDALRTASNNMIDILDNLKTIYPEATLHDCLEGTTNPVRLGKTSLGSL